MGAGPTKQYHKVLNANFIEGSLTCLRPEIIEEKITPEFPLMLNIEPTNACNSSCWYCPREINAEKNGVHWMGMDLYNKIIDDIHPHKLLMLNFHKDGEPLLNESLPLMIRKAREKDAAEIIHMNTNGLLLKSSIAEECIREGIHDITVSIDASREETYRKLKRIKDLAKVENGVRSIIEFRDKINAETIIRVKIMEFSDVSQEELDEFVNKWTGIADQVQVMGSHSWGGEIEGMDVTDETPGERWPCLLLWYIMAVNADGKVSKCNYDWNHSGIIGDAKQESLKEIWKGKKIKSYRLSHLEGDWSCNQVCKECVAWAGFDNMREFLKSQEGYTV